MNSRLFRCRTVAALVVCLSGTIPTSAIADQNDSYIYRLEEGKESRVCQHMRNIYNQAFRRPWDFGNLPVWTPPFPRLPGVEYDQPKAAALRFSAFPSSPEFDAIPWTEGRAANSPFPTLIAELDIDNDGQPEILIKSSFMQSFSPGHNSVPGGEDTVWIVDKGHVSLAAPLTVFDLYKSVGRKRPSRLGMDTFGMPVRSIRPFRFEGTTYLSMYEQEVSHEGKRWRTRETMWVMKYQQGGWNKGGGNWEPVQAARVCRFRMLPVKETS